MLYVVLDCWSASEHCFLPGSLPSSVHPRLPTQWTQDQLPCQRCRTNRSISCAAAAAPPTEAKRDAAGAAAASPCAPVTPAFYVNLDLKYVR